MSTCSVRLLSTCSWSVCRLLILSCPTDFLQFRRLQFLLFSPVFFKCFYFQSDYILNVFIFLHCLVLELSICLRLGANCLTDTVISPTPPQELGELFSPDQQCRLLKGPEGFLCRVGSLALFICCFGIFKI